MQRVISLCDGPQFCGYPEVKDPRRVSDLVMDSHPPLGGPEDIWSSPRRNLSMTDVVVCHCAIWPGTAAMLLLLPRDA
jgi:hypothetical protein